MQCFNWSYYGATFLILMSLSVNAALVRKLSLPKIKTKGTLVKPSENNNGANGSRHDSLKVAQAHRKTTYKATILNIFAKQLAQAPQEVDRMLASLSVGNIKTRGRKAPASDW
jgi:hypothetical protein